MHYFIVQLHVRIECIFKNVCVQLHVPLKIIRLLHIIGYVTGPLLY